MAIKKLGRFEIVEEIGSGGMGLVYKGRDPKINRLVALKVVRPQLGSRSTDQQQAVDRFYVEARAAGQLTHPNIVIIYDVGEEQTPDGSLVYIAMEFVAGKGLEHHIAQQTFSALEDQVNIIKQVADGLDYAHKRGVVHRDIKPANILITEENIPKITDFGLARLSDSSLTMSGTILGTPNYMSPEQVQGKKVDARSDYFSLTVLFYEMITREKPFAAETITSVIYKVVNEDPIPPRRLNAQLPPSVDAFIKKGLSKNPDQRFQNGAEYVKALNSLLSGGADGFDNMGDSTLVMDGQTAAKTKSASMKIAAAAPSKGLYAGAGAAAILIVAGLFFLMKGKEEPPKAQQTVAALAPAAAPAVPSPAATPAPVAPPQAAPAVPAPVAPGEAPKKEEAAKPAETPKASKPEDKTAENKKPEKKDEKAKGAEKEDKSKKKKEVASLGTIEKGMEGYLSVQSEPNDAEVFINGKFIGSTPINNLKVKQGDITLKVVKQGYSTYTKKVAMGQKGAFTVALIKASEKPGGSATAQNSSPSAGNGGSGATGGLEIIAPPQSVVYVDGREFKEEKVKVSGLSTGSHLVYVQLKGRKPYNNRVVIKQGETVKLDLR